MASEITPNPASGGTCAARPATSWKSSVPNVTQIRKTPRRNPKSPMRLTTNAFLPASDADCFVNQNPIRR